MEWFILDDIREEYLNNIIIEGKWNHTGSNWSRSELKSITPISLIPGESKEFYITIKLMGKVITGNENNDLNIEFNLKGNNN